MPITNPAATASTFTPTIQHVDKSKSAAPAGAVRDVQMGDCVLLKGDNTTTLRTNYLSSCSAVVLCGDKNASTGVYEKRLMMHLTGSCLQWGLAEAEKDAEYYFSQFTGCKDLKMVLVGGADMPRNYSLSVALGQTYKGYQPLMELQKQADKKFQLAVGVGVICKPNGDWGLIHPVRLPLKADQVAEVLKFVK